MGASSADVLVASLGIPTYGEDKKNAELAVRLGGSQPLSPSLARARAPLPPRPPAHADAFLNEVRLLSPPNPPKPRHHARPSTASRSATGRPSRCSARARPRAASRWRTRGPRSRATSSSGSRGRRTPSSASRRAAAAAAGRRAAAGTAAAAAATTAAAAPASALGGRGKREGASPGRSPAAAFGPPPRDLL